MKIGVEHIGKTVTKWVHPDFYTEVLYVGRGGTFFGREQNGWEGTMNCDDDWRIWNEKKRPSETILQDANEMVRYGSMDPFAVSKVENKVSAILRYLDKQAEEKK